jgi:hypothetical protein
MESPKVSTPPAPSADWTIAGGCPVCGGALDVRRRPGSARSYCSACKFLGRPSIGPTPFGIQVKHPLQIC